MPVADRGRELAEKLMKHLGAPAREDADDPIEKAHSLLDEHMAKAAEGGQGDGDEYKARVDAMMSRMDEFMSAMKPADRKDAEHEEPDGDEGIGGEGDGDGDEEEEEEEGAPARTDSADLWLSLGKVSERLGLEPKDIKGKTAQQARDLCLTRMDSKADFSKKSEAYKQARFDAELPRFLKRGSSGLQTVIDRAGAEAASTRQDTAPKSFADRLLNMNKAKK